MTENRTCIDFIRTIIESLKHSLEATVCWTVHWNNHGRVDVGWDVKFDQTLNQLQVFFDQNGRVLIFWRLVQWNWVVPQTWKNLIVLTWWTSNPWWFHHITHVKRQWSFMLWCSIEKHSIWMLRFKKNRLNAEKQNRNQIIAFTVFVRWMDKQMRMSTMRTNKCACLSECFDIAI